MSYCNTCGSSAVYFKGDLPMGILRCFLCDPLTDEEYNSDQQWPFPAIQIYRDLKRPKAPELTKWQHLKKIFGR